MRTSCFWQEGGRRAFLSQRSFVARRSGAARSENVGMSSAHPRKNRGPQKPKVSSAMFVNGGLGGPNLVLLLAGRGKGRRLIFRPFHAVVLEGRSEMLCGRYWSSAARIIRDRKTSITYAAWKPYRKPTQVGEARSLRGTG